MALTPLPNYVAGIDLAVITIDGVIFNTYTRSIFRTIDTTPLNGDIPAGSELVYTVKPTTGTVLVQAQAPDFTLDPGEGLTVDMGVYHTPTRGLVIAPLV